MKALEVWDWGRVEAVTFWSCFNNFYKGKLGKTGRLLLWKCAWGSCMADPWTSLLSWTSLTSTTGDSRETVWHGDAPEGDSFARPSAQGGTTRKGTNKDKPKGEPLTGDSFNASKTILTNWGSSMSMLVGPLQFGGLPRDHSCWHRHSSPKWKLWRSEIGAGSKLWPFEGVLTISIKGN